MFTLNFYHVPFLWKGCGHVKAEMLQNLLFSKFSEYFPEKSRIVSDDDQPYFSEKLQNSKEEKEESITNRKSGKWKRMNFEYDNELSKSKKNFYRSKIQHLRKVKPKHWFREYKKLTSYEKFKSEEIMVENIKDLPNKRQAEMIADKFAEVSLEYDKLLDGDIEIPKFKQSDVPQFFEDDVKAALEG